MVTSIDQDKVPQWGDTRDSWLPALVRHPPSSTSNPIGDGACSENFFSRVNDATTVEILDGTHPSVP